MPRQREIDRVSRPLLHHGYPRLDMAVLALVTGLAACIASFILLLLWLWLMYRRLRGH